MSIEKITVKETEWKNGEPITSEKEYTRDASDDFDWFILTEMRSSDIRTYARQDMGMIKESECPRYDPSDLDTEELIEELKERGFDVIECQTLSDSFKLEHLKEKMKIA